MNKRMALMALLIFLGTSLVATAGTTPEPKQINTKPSTNEMTSVYKGKMQLSDDFFDFGYTPQSCKVTHTFWLKNVGVDSLEIIRIKPG